ncbi:tRNA pseudouridine(55) synthase [Plasmodiophora brassicae]|uniref:tRNA pseudouridine(55) synthase n=1 Tax=Plasmodiophora brassicae TaxID=37360 RepID=A0A3P3YJ11_PLABS|nr:unnamed protein product [Plasmodiophora brassicae]
MTICYEPMTEPALKKIEPVVAELRVRACDRCLLRFGDCRSIQSYRVTSSALRQQFLAAGVSPACLLDASAVCDLCLGILQVPEDPSCDHLINRLASSATYGEYEFSDFTLSIGLPPVLDLRNAGVAARLEMRYPGAFPGVVDVKDAVKWVYGAVVRGATGKSFKFQSEFQVDVLATHDETDDEIIQALSPLIRRVLPDASSKRLKHVVVNSRNFAEKALAVMNVSERSTLVPAKTTVAPCVIAITVSRQPVLITGKYRKFCRLLSQSPWVIDNKRKTESSVQELIADQVTAFIKCSDIKFHSAGREDVDVRMLGDGRHFVLEMIDPRRVPSLKELEELCLRINNSTDRIEVHSLSVAPDYAKEFKTLQAGADSKRKSYRAIMWTSAALTDEAVRTLQGSAPIEIQQKTPIRVLHRRSLLSRPRTIYELSITRINKHFAVLDLVAQAGTYIKEFVHGDRGRTTPSVGDILTCQADIVQLDVMDLHTGH